MTDGEERTEKNEGGIDILLCMSRNVSGVLQGCANSGTGIGISHIDIGGDP